MPWSYYTQPTRPWGLAAYYGPNWYPSQPIAPAANGWTYDPISPQASSQVPIYSRDIGQAKEATNNAVSVYPTTSPAFTNWYPPQVRPAYEDYYDSKSGGIPTAYSDYYNGCEGDCDCYGPCDYNYDNGNDDKVSDECPWQLPGWANVDGKRIYLSLPENNLSWYKSEARAKEMGQNTSLFKVINSEDENILSLVKKCYSGDTGLWIGGNDIADKGHWVWTDGEPLNVEMTEKIDTSVVGHCLQADLNSNSLKSAACASTAVRRTAFVALESATSAISSTKPPLVESTTARMETTTPNGGVAPTPA